MPPLLRLHHPKLNWRHLLVKPNSMNSMNFEVPTCSSCCLCWCWFSGDYGCTRSCLDRIALTSLRCWSVAVAVPELKALATNSNLFAFRPIFPVWPTNHPTWKVIKRWQINISDMTSCTLLKIRYLSNTIDVSVTLKYMYLQAHWDTGQPRLGKVPLWNKRRLLETLP